MATITKRKTGRNVQVRRKGFPPLSKTLPSKSEAVTWARDRERLMDVGQLTASDAILKTTTLGQLIGRYRVDVTPKRRGAASEDLRLGRLQRDPVSSVTLKSLSAAHFASFRDRRLQEVKPGTVRRELYLLSSAITVATKEWGYPFLSNPVRQIAIPVANDGRDRRLEAGEGERLRQALAQIRNPLVAPIVELAIETGLRRREVLELTRGNVDLKRRVAFIPLTKSGVPRTIPLTGKAIAIIEGLAPGGDLLFPISANAFRLAWTRVQVRSGLKDLRFHDLRHEALSRFCELGLTIPELAVISGHKDPRMLFRYAHLRADDLARKLAGKSWEDREAA